MIEFGHGTHAGLRRKRNEDTYYADAGIGLFLVADGMGGHSHGELAAALARDGIVEDVGAGASLEHAIRRADERIIGQRQDAAERLPMGTTIAALRMDGDTFDVAWVGDSRIYLWQDGLRRLSHDHSLVQELVERGVVDEAQAREHPRRNVVTQALGVTAPDELRIEGVRGRLEPGMRFLLCSDGLTDAVDETAMAAIVARDDLAAQESVDHLLLAALDGGGHDNVTAILVRMR
ncbi:MAG TPA: protein phosphatase 2C domain-containing protein [Rhodanobacteraceae bacterium]|nr:protein phosphatase 2C domain-containing protein [Rhodanobacteraceae bacterium]